MHFGIDLGTSNSAIAGVSGGRIKIFKTPEGTDTMPSVIHRNSRGNQTVGVRAFDQAGLTPHNAVEGFKRQMGTDTAMRFASTGDTITPEQAATEILRSLVGQALMESGTQTITGAVVTIPAAFNQMQSEATLAAARAAGLDRIALLQEPVAAALAAVAGARDRNGLFLVYDLGGGTFDAALVQAMEGEITVVAHEGVNMLGGRDLDRQIMDNIAFPWLKRTFDLPANFSSDPRYLRLVRMARRAAEVAKIALSTKEGTTISASDDEVRLQDLRGEPIYFDAPLTRENLDAFVGDMAAQSIKCCRDMLAKEGYRHEDVSRVVLIGGPTKMPFLRRKVQDELGIQAEDAARVDPMTAVAAGAAIYCEGRDWSASTSVAKANRRSDVAGHSIKVSLDYEVRTTFDQANFRITQTAGDKGLEVLLNNLLGWSSGRRKLGSSLELKLPLKDMGPNRFRVTVFAANGLPVADASQDIEIDRLLAATGGVPAAHTIAAKVRGDNDERDILSILVNKGQLLPATAAVHYQLAMPFRSGDGGKIRIQLYQMTDLRIMEPHLNLMIGEFQIGAEDLPQSATLSKGDEVIIHWFLSDSHKITVEVGLPSVGQRFDNSKFYNWQMSRQDFSGEEGAKLALAHLAPAERELESAEEAVPPAYAIRLPHIRKLLDMEQVTLRQTLEPETRVVAVEKVRLLRQEIAIICQEPEAKRHLLRQRLAAQSRFFDRDVRSDATPEQVAQVDVLLRKTATLIDQCAPHELEHASNSIRHLGGLYWSHGLEQKAFCFRQFEMEKENRHLAKDLTEFDRLVCDGNAGVRVGDLVAVRRAMFGIFSGQISVGSDMIGPERASLMKM